MNTLGERITYARDFCDMKQHELASAIGVTNSTMSKYENNVNVPNAETLCKIAEVLKTSTDYLVGLAPYNDINIPADYPEYSTENLFNTILKLNDENRLRIYERVITLLEQQS